MRKLKILLINLVLLAFAVILVELIASYTYYREKNFHILRNNWNREKIQPFFEWLSKNIMFNRKYYFQTQDFRKPSGKNYKKSAIVLMGCSFTYGNMLSDNETFSYVLSEYTKRPVYNIALDAASPREALYILKNDYYRNELLKSPKDTEYFIYTYITDQLPRLYADVYRIPEPVFWFDKSKSKLQYVNSENTFLRSYFYFFISRHFAFQIDKREKFKLFSVYMNEIKKEIQNNFSYKNKKAKLVILVYEDSVNQNWEVFQNDDIIVVKVKELVKENIFLPQYQTQDRWHPSEKAWKLIVPKLAEKLELSV